MFNLLPEPEKKQILEEYRGRFFIVALLFLFVLTLIAIIAAFPAYLLSSSRVGEVEESLRAIRRSSIFSQESALNNELSQTNQKLVALRPEEGVMPPSDMFQIIIEHRTGSIRLNGLLYKHSNGEGSALLNGVARDREALSEFVETLRKDTRFSEVNLPISNFAKDRNAEFSLELKGKF